jgi:predicted amidohydrolase YtcJ
MASIEILGWKKDFVGFTAWDAHAKSELRRRLRGGLHASQAEIKRVARRIDARELVSLRNVYDEAVESIVQILETTGADLRVSIEGSNPEQLFRKLPKRR